MRKILSYICVFSCTVNIALAQIKVEKPLKSHERKAFAIIIDAETYARTKEAVQAYREVVEKDGLPTYIISGKFSRPEEVKKQILKIYQSKYSLEGVVLIGEIPVPMIRNAQHLTTAFKMNEDKYAFDQSSVPSDRFYDDLNLKFEYLRTDPEHPLNHYYKLSENSVQSLRPSIYSARIRYPKAKGGNAHAAISAYLEKVVRTRRDDLLDHFVSFTGAGYNSECLVAWKDDLKSYKEDFPYLGKQVKNLKQLNFRMDNAMKFKLFDEMQRPEVDVMLMRQHGTPTTELINNSPDGTTFEIRIEALRRELYANMNAALKRNKNIDSLEAVYLRKYQLKPEFFDQLSNPELLKKDSLLEASLSIRTRDLAQLKSNPRYMILDACYNGSFHEDDYIAGYYIFNEGNTIAAQANTRNVLQDKWTMNLSGLLSYGLRLGQLQQLTATLENHLIGDPTFHFGSRENAGLRQQITANTDRSYWQGLLKKNDPIYQSIALVKLAAMEPDFSKTLLDYFRNSPYRTVRLQALTQLAICNDSNFLSALEAGLTDEYEMIARQSAIYAAATGTPSLISKLADVWVNDKSRQRVLFNVESAFSLFNQKQMKEALISASKNSNRTAKLQEMDSIDKLFSQKRRAVPELVKLQQRDLAVAQRINMIRNLRNYNDHENIAIYLAILNDANEPDTIRIAMAEALGWFNHSIVRQQITENCIQLSGQRVSRPLQAELIQTLNRLK